MGKIRIQNLKFYTYNGVLPEEKKLGQPIAIDLELTVPIENPGRTDQVGDTVSYAEVNAQVAEFVKSHSYNLMESLVVGILDLIEKLFDKVEVATVKIRKFSVPMAGIYDYIEIEETRNFKK
ncbi:dihydroneopterin aldolase [Enterococcus timonensis]|uniref:dihydroneopterin aldolase n=1 Tax=Enterococcus timonensis TaxID=1852364 RepID=UPI0008D98156|nr:dihydroneopterin aldolase [Enterococcus timonensis]